MALRDVDAVLSLSQAARVRAGVRGETLPAQGFAELDALYTRAEALLLRQAEALEARGASAFSIADRRNRLAVVRRRMADVRQSTAQWMREAIPFSYADGYQESINEIGAVNSVFSTVNLAGAESLTREAASDVAGALIHAEDGLTLRSAILTVTSEDIPLGLLEGKGSKAIARDLANRLEDEFGFTRFRGPGSRTFTTAQMIENMEHVGGQSFVGFRDRRGRPWSVQNYTNMLARTKVQQANRAGADQFLDDNDMDVVRVSTHGATDSCIDFEGAELSRNGKTPWLPTVEKASASSHLFGPNCKHGYFATSSRFRSASKQADIDESNRKAAEAVTRSASENEAAARAAQREAEAATAEAAA